ncbi:hypothetical protein ABT56_19140 [Photobacterium aquae]|uniref:Uncharacterized protein n=2 Tax=Photobacterium aquae TaxID=1195763 RepID=A0A0J1GVA9_9GAMM|nr:hypothetical protein ABT56_19140 [Photobacterium aquae]
MNGCGGDFNAKKHEKFKSLCESRVNIITKNFRLLSNLSNKKNYAYTDGDIDKVFKHLHDELKKCKENFSDKNEKNKFSLD